MAYENLTDQLAILRRQDLSATERFVAIVALSFRNSESGRCNPPVYSDDAKKESLCSRSGYTKQCITKTLAALETKRVIVLKKHVARPSEITFTVNDVYGKQGLPSTTITATVNDVYGKGKRRLPITDKEQISNREVVASDDAPKAKKVRNSFVTASKPDDVPQALWDDFITHRRAKKAPVTETVISRTRSQAQKCGMTLAEALEMTVARGWQGFEARYVLDNRQSPAKPAQQLELSPQAIARRRQAAANKVSPEDAAIADMWEDIFG